MSHAITVGGLLAAIGILAGFVMSAGGVLALFAAGMSDAPSQVNSKPGCIAIVLGIALMASSIWAVLL